MEVQFHCFVTWISKQLCHRFVIGSKCMFCKVFCSQKMNDHLTDVLVCTPQRHMHEFAFAFAMFTTCASIGQISLTSLVWALITWSHNGWNHVCCQCWHKWNNFSSCTMHHHPCQNDHLWQRDPNPLPCFCCCENQRLAVSISTPPIPSGCCEWSIRDWLASGFRRQQGRFRTNLTTLNWVSPIEVHRMTLFFKSSILSRTSYQLFFRHRHDPVMQKKRAMTRKKKPHRYCAFPFSTIQSACRRLFIAQVNSKQRRITGTIITTGLCGVCSSQLLRSYC